MWKCQLQSMAVESAIRKIRKIEVFKKWKLQSMDCNQDYYHSQYWLQPDYYGNMDIMNYRNNYYWYICSVAEWKYLLSFVEGKLRFSMYCTILELGALAWAISWGFSDPSPTQDIHFWWQIGATEGVIQ